MTTTNNVLSALLLALGFNAMANEVLTETDRDRLIRYARVIIKNSPEAQRPAIVRNLRALGLA